ncbi:unnamed protein product [Cuscuta epithymum]|uniref:Protein NRT1/ PTR FAMILY 1.2-like n=1 Tax=Cuscuta epithymum TaxID=186058 RepID=A0AAV0FLU0_9ASTE|nr:unnamed protein product [Cuscuta epithymum]
MGLMGVCSSDEKQKKTMVEEEEKLQPLLEASPAPQGGFRTMPFIAGNLALMLLANCGLTPNMILYLMREYRMDMATGSNVLYWWNAASNITPVVGALMADSFVGRFQIISIGSVINLLGILLFWLTTIIPQTRPPPCTESNIICPSATTLQLLFLYLSFILISIGEGGVKASSLAFGVEQLNNIRKNEKAMESFFGCYYGVKMVSVIISLTLLVYVQENMGWEIGFGILVLLMLFATILILLGSPFYVRSKPKGSLIMGLVQVVVAFYRKRSLVIPPNGGGLVAYHQQGTVICPPSETLRFLNKACIIEDPQQDVNSDGKASDPWSLCTVEQVEELKACIKVIPIWVTGVIMSINASQSTFSTLQATTMNRHIGSSSMSFQIPTGSISMFSYTSIIMWLVFDDRIIRRRLHFSPMARMGSGIFVSFLSVVVTALVEAYRRNLAIKEGFSENPGGIVDMSVLWIIPRSLLAGVAEGMNAVAQNEFYISEFPQSMWSIASNFFGLGVAAANMLASFLMSFVNEVTKGGEGGSWISSNINQGHYDYYNWVLAGLSLLNLLLFIFCSRAYGPCREERKVKGGIEVESS